MFTSNQGPDDANGPDQKVKSSSEKGRDSNRTKWASGLLWNSGQAPHLSRLHMPFSRNEELEQTQH